MKRRLFHIAHTVKQHFANFSEALTYAWRIVKLQVALCLGVVKFEYLKKDGTVRQATGSNCDVPKTAGTRPANYGVITYFDLDAQAWRSFQSHALILN